MTLLKFSENVGFRVSNIGAWAHQTALDLGSAIKGLTFGGDPFVKNFDLSTSVANESGTGDGIRANIEISTEEPLKVSDVRSINNYFNDRNLGSISGFKR